ncbi:MAG: sporulation transcriptional regulator SpoIIID [Ruminococcus sp.]|nr:sporulation transcriptional regulator SpoIIID [Ruminococcus sp.]
MKQAVEERAIELGEYIIESRATVRRTAKKFGISKSTVHKDVSQRLQNLNPSLYNEVKEVLEYNKAERHLRGGLATRNKYLSLSDSKKQVQK